ncbi:MRN complex-interacting protein [Leuresthes tenuis]|uniref:MRN complex-interacting protein n=1 Tax=Leuresthes tenuis TaxID=355514 RepID=UPI003B50C616
MVQEFHVVRCFTCQAFQVQQVKKVNRWSCKLCGQKQSLLKEFGQGSAADCRRHVQKLNAMRGAAMEAQEHSTWSLCEQVEADGEEEQRADQLIQVRDFQVSRWNKYIHPAQEAEPKAEKPPEVVLMDGQHLELNSTGVRKRQRSESEEYQSLYNSHTPGQPSCPTPPRPSPAARTSPPHTGPLSKRCGTDSKWDRFHSSVSQVQEEEPTACGWGQSSDEPTVQANVAITRIHPQFPVSSMFESGDDFNFDDDFQRI